MTAKEVLEQLRDLGSESIKKVLRNHGVREPFFGVRIGDMKPLQKRIKRDYQLALDLYETGIYDAMYFAGLIADDARMTKADLKRWAKQAYGAGLPSATVPWVAAGNKHGYALALEWIESPQEHIAVAGWSTLCSIVALVEDDALDLPALKKLLARVQRSIHRQPNHVRYAMNNFVICLGSYVKPLTAAALQAAAKIGSVEVDMGQTACQVPDAAGYIKKVQQSKHYGRKRKTVKC